MKTESYNLKADAQNKIIKEALIFTGKHYYDGNKEVASSTWYDQNGEVGSQTYALSENGNQLLRLDYDHRAAKENTKQRAADNLSYYRFSDDEPELKQRLKYLLKFDRCVENSDWIPANFQNQFYKFDAHGNMIVNIYGRRTPLPGDKGGMIFEREYIYY